MSWTVAPALEQLRNEVNARWPNRSKASDGFIGDAAHAASASDHNPNQAGVVCAFDITHDPANGPDIGEMYEFLRNHPHPNQKYIIANHRLASRQHGPWTDRAYTGDPHTNHIHVSVGVGSDGRSVPGSYDDTTPWLTGFQQEDDEDMAFEEKDSKTLADISVHSAKTQEILQALLESQTDVVKLLNKIAAK